VVDGGHGRSLAATEKVPLTSVFRSERRLDRHLRKLPGERSGRWGRGFKSRRPDW